MNTELAAQRVLNEHTARLLGIVSEETARTNQEAAAKYDPRAGILEAINTSHHPDGTPVSQAEKIQRIRQLASSAHHQDLEGDMIEEAPTSETSPIANTREIIANVTDDLKEICDSLGPLAQKAAEVRRRAELDGSTLRERLARAVYQAIQRYYNPTTKMTPRDIGLLDEEGIRREREALSRHAKEAQLLIDPESPDGRSLQETVNTARSLYERINSHLADLISQRHALERQIVGHQPPDLPQALQRVQAAKEELRKLEKLVAELESRLAAAQQQKEDQFQEHVRNIRKLQEAKDDAQNAYNAEADKTAPPSPIKDAAEKQRNEVRVALEKAIDERAGVKAQIQANQKAIEPLHEIEALCEQQRADIQRQIDDLKEQKNEKEYALRSAQDKLHKLQNEIDLESEEIKKKRNNLKKELKNAKNALRELDRDSPLEELDTELSDLENKIREAKSRKKLAPSEQHTELSHQIALYEKTLEELTSRRDAHKARRTELFQKVRQLEEEISQLDSNPAVENKMNNIKILHEEIQKIEADLTSYHLKITPEIINFEGRISAVSDLLGSINAQIAQKEGEVSHLEEIFNSLDTQVNDLTSQLADLENQLLQLDLEHATSRKDLLEARLEEATKKLKSYKKKIDDEEKKAAQKLSQLTEDLNKSKKALEEASQTVESALDDLIAAAARDAVPHHPAASSLNRGAARLYSATRRQHLDEIAGLDEAIRLCRRAMTDMSAPADRGGNPGIYQGVSQVIKTIQSTPEVVAMICQDSGEIITCLTRLRTAITEGLEPEREALLTCQAQIEAAQRALVNKFVSREQVEKIAAELKQALNALDQTRNDAVAKLLQVLTQLKDTDVNPQHQVWFGQLPYHMQIPAYKAVRGRLETIGRTVSDAYHDAKELVGKLQKEALRRKKSPHGRT